MTLPGHSDEAVKLSIQWRQEWTGKDRPDHSCLQNAVHLLEGDTLCGVCGAVFDLGSDDCGYEECD